MLILMLDFEFECFNTLDSNQIYLTLPPKKILPFQVCTIMYNATFLGTLNRVQHGAFKNKTEQFQFGAALTLELAEFLGL